MADDDLQFTIKMRDEASAILDKASKSVQEHGLAHETAAGHAGSFAAAIREATGHADTFGGAIKNVAIEMVKLGAPLAGGILAAESLHGVYDKVKETLHEMVEATIAQEKAMKALNGVRHHGGGGLVKHEVVERSSDSQSTFRTSRRSRRPARR